MRERVHWLPGGSTFPARNPAAELPLLGTRIAWRTRNLAPGTINGGLAAVHHVAYEAADLI